VFVNRVLRRIFGLKRDEVMGGWRKQHTEELHDLYSSPSIIRIMKSRRVGHVVQMGRRGMCIGY
jgi:PAS domain-containing protein